MTLNKLSRTVSVPSLPFTMMERALAHARRKIVHQMHESVPRPRPETRRELPKPVKELSEPVKKLSEHAEQYWLDPIWFERLFFGGLAAVFGSVTVAALTGYISIWWIILGVLGLIFTGMMYIVAWAENEAFPYTKIY
jgi:hypothetical protein